MVHPRLIALNASGNSSSLLTLCRIETRSQEHVNRNTFLRLKFVSVVDSTLMPVYRVCRKKNEKEKKKVKSQLHSAKKLHKHHLYPQFQLFVCVSMHVPKVITDCDGVSTEHLFASTFV